MVRFIAGSSPQARGTRLAIPVGVLAGRFIPAGAGNTFCVLGAFPGMTVHPRRRGEHASILCSVALASGSSPQARGTLLEMFPDKADSGFIPAGAGNTRSRPATGCQATVHPRRRGEHTSELFNSPSKPGSSPQARGTRSRGILLFWTGRFIPAGAGNTRVADFRYSPRSVHPRRRGEHGIDAQPAPTNDGSSPQARGTHRDLRTFEYAGAVHPRRRGEHVSLAGESTYAAGSSPQARGTLRTSFLGFRLFPVHPRRRGEHFDGPRELCVQPRFIPAGAGNTLPLTC